MSEIYLDEAKISKISPQELTIINIFNDHSKTRKIFRKKKFAIKYKKGLEKKQFFKVRKIDHIREAKLKEIQNIANERQTNKKITIEKNSEIDIYNNRLNLCNQLLKIINYNKSFIELVNENVTYDLSLNINCFENYLHTIAIFLSK